MASWTRHVRVVRREWGGIAAAGQVIYEYPHRDVHARRDVAHRRRRASRPRAAWRHRRRDDAHGRLRRGVRVGLRRREPLRPDAALWHARRPPRASWIARTPLGLGVMLDVVYNHLGPDGNYLNDFSPDYFTDKYTQRLGARDQLRGTGAGTRALRRERRLLDRRVPFRRAASGCDAGRHDASQEHVIASLVRRARAAGGRRQVYVVAENEPQDTRLSGRPNKAATESTRSGTTIFSTWPRLRSQADARRITGTNSGTPQEFVSASQIRLLYQGQWYSWQRQATWNACARSTGVSFVGFLENHDQVANSAFGKRLASVVVAPDVIAR